MADPTAMTAAAQVMFRKVERSADG